MQLLRRLGVLAGLLFLAWAVHSVGWSAIWQEFSRMGWRLIFILIFYLVIFGLDTWGWHYAFLKHRHAPWRSLFLTRLAGEAVNYVTPFAAMGGEPVKAFLLKNRHGIPMTEGFSSVVIAKTAITAGLLLFALCGAGMALFFGHLPISLARIVWAVLGTLGVLTGLFVVAQRRGIFKRLIPILENWMGARNVGIEVAGHEIDSTIRHFYRSERGRLALSVAFHFLGWVAGVAEVWLILHFIGIPVSFIQAWIIESLWQLMKAGAFMIPAAVGAQEGSILLIFFSLGLSLPAALALGLVRRIRELVWAGVGLVIWSGYEYAPARP